MEFALGIALLWVLFAGVYQYGYSFFIYNRLQLSVSNAAMYASMTTYDASYPSNFVNTIKNLAVYGKVSGGTKPVVPGLTTGNIEIVTNPIAGLPTVVTIRVKNYQLPSIFARYMLRDKPRVTTLFIGQITCSTC
ncbi:MAG: pilus assembly protein [Acidobacteria bacterium]|nr:pilus assembly protein [Acidobacteriota bacterium]